MGLRRAPTEPGVGELGTAAAVSRKPSKSPGHARDTPRTRPGHAEHADGLWRRVSGDTDTQDLGARQTDVQRSCSIPVLA